MGLSWTRWLFPTWLPSRKGVGPMRPATLAIIGTALGAAAIYAVARAAGLTDLGLRVDLAEGDWE